MEDARHFDPVAWINTPRWQASRLGLSRMVDLLERLGRPQDELRFVHVAGTNGKGSVCAYVASVLQAAGYKVGLFTSPFILCFEERIRVNGENITGEELARAVAAVRPAAAAVEAACGDHPTEFELMAAVAFEHFRAVGCDIVVLEVGLGGRLDATNVIEAPEASVICRIGLDHTDLLGDTLGAIAGEKAEMLIIAAATEADIAELESYDERQMFLEDLGLEESGVARLIKSAYKLLNLETFFTTGADETRAWTYSRGMKAPQTAGIIHTDFEKGFIRAEVIKYDDYVTLGSEKACRDAGKLSIEGKEYVVEDGDIMHFLFNV